MAFLGSKEDVPVETGGESPSNESFVEEPDFS
jgi:hypothetical protein